MTMMTEENVRQVLNKYGYDYSDLDFARVTRLSNKKSSNNEFVVRVYEPNTTLMINENRVELYKTNTTMERYKDDQKFVHPIAREYKEFAAIAFEEDYRTIHCFYDSIHAFESIIETYVATGDEAHKTRLFASRLFLNRQEASERNIAELIKKSKEEWQHGKIKMLEFYNTGSLSRLSSMDADLPQQVSDSFILQPVGFVYPDPLEIGREASDYLNRSRFHQKRAEEIREESEKHLSAEQILESIYKIERYASVEKVEIQENSVYIYTNCIYHMFEERRYLLGQFKIEISLNRDLPRITAYQNNVDDASYIHPHIQRTGNVCWGNILDMAKEAMKELDIEKAFEASMFVLEHINHGDTYIALLDHFAVAEDD